MLLFFLVFSVKSERRSKSTKMESFLNDINGIHGDIVEAELNADKLIAVGFRFEYILDTRFGR